MLIEAGKSGDIIIPEGNKFSCNYKAMFRVLDLVIVELAYHCNVQLSVETLLATSKYATSNWVSGICYSSAATNHNNFVFMNKKSKDILLGGNMVPEESNLYIYLIYKK